jgi:hypothetical protein
MGHLASAYRKKKCILMQVGYQGHQQGMHQLDEALITEPRRKLAAQVIVDIFGVVGFSSVLYLTREVPYPELTLTYVSVPFYLTGRLLMDRCGF